jgi:ABC-type amino acid transport substrate-binding protein
MRSVYSRISTSIFWVLMIVALGWPGVGVGQANSISPTPLDDWARIQRTGRIFVGVAPDDPPFAYPGDAFVLDGFDVAVMRALAERLGVQAEFSAVVFPSLLDAVRLGQVDAAISAIAITDGRSEEVDFSDPYYISTEGFLVALPPAETAPIVIIGAEDLVGYKIGVQAGTIYAGWLRENLIEAGKASEEKLLLFNTIDQMIAALTKGEIDVAMLDNLDAAYYASQGGFAVAGQGLTRQFLGIAARKGSTLTAQINAALQDLQQEGLIVDLAGHYFPNGHAAPQALSTPTAPPSPTPAPCTFFARYVADLTYDDAAGPPVVQPGQPIDKEWQIMNTGDCAWSPDFRVVYYGGERMGGQPISLGRSVAPGERYDVKIMLSAPVTPGTYRSQWGLTDAQGNIFGQPFWATVTVPGAPPPPPPVPPSPGPIPTPAPPPMPAPTINDFHASHHKVAVGLCVKLKWQVSGTVSEVKIKRDGNDWKTGLGMSGSKKDCPSTDGKHTYELKVSGPGGTARESVDVKFKYIPLTGDAGEAPGGDE